jgi:hypothetical protein
VTEHSGDLCRSPNIIFLYESAPINTEITKFLILSHRGKLKQKRRIFQIFESAAEQKKEGGSEKRRLILTKKDGHGRSRAPYPSIEWEAGSHSWAGCPVLEVREGSGLLGVEKPGLLPPRGK